jgi:hypothetical protein
MSEEIQSGACLYIPRMQVRAAVMKTFQPPFDPKRTNTDSSRCENSKNQYDIDLRYLQAKSGSQSRANWPSSSQPNWCCAPLTPQSWTTWKPWRRSLN